MSCFTVGSVGRHSNTHAHDGTDPVTPEMIGITGQHARGTAVAIDGVIPDTALTEFVVHGKSTQAAVPSPDVSIPTGNNLFRGVGMPNDEEGYWDTINTSLSEASSDGFAHWKRTADQTENGSRYAALAAFPTVQPATEYKILVEFRNVIEPPSVSFIINANRSTTQPVGVFSEYLSISGQTITEGYRKVITATTRDVFEADGLPATIALGTTVTASEGTSYDFEARISIYPADYDVTEYEPYTGGPVEIESAEVGSAWVCGKNLYPLDDIPLGVSNGVTLTRRGDVFYFTGTRESGSVSNGWLYSIRNDVDNYHRIFPTPGKYTLSIEKNISQSTAYAVISLTIDGKRVIDTSAGTTSLTRTVNVLPEYWERENFTLSVGFYASGAGEYITDGLICTVQLEPGERATPHDMPYVPAQTYPVDLTLRGIPVDSGGNYTDADGQEWICDTYDAASGEYVRRVNTIESYASEDVNAPYMSTTGELTAGAFVQYALYEPVVTHLPTQYIRAFSPVTNAAAGGAEIAVEYNNVAGSAYKPPSPVAVTLAAADWTGDAAPYSQTVTAAGAAAKAGSAVETAESATDAQYTAALDAKLRRAAQSGADVTIKAYGTKPAIDIPILL